MKRFLVWFLTPAVLLLAAPAAFGQIAKVLASTTTTVASNGTACTTAGGASCSVILASTDISGWANVALTVRNSGVSNALTNCLVEVSDDGTNWEIWNSTTFAALPASTALSAQISGNSRHYIRAEGRSSAGTTTAVSLVANNSR